MQQLTETEIKASPDQVDDLMTGLLAESRENHERREGALYTVHVRGVDDVKAVRTLEDGQLAGVPTAGTDYVEAIAKIGDRLAILLNPDGLFAGVQIAA